MKTTVPEDKLIPGDRIVQRLDREKGYIVERWMPSDSRSEPVNCMMPDKPDDLLANVPWYEGGHDFSGHP